MFTATRVVNRITAADVRVSESVDRALCIRLISQLLTAFRRRLQNIPCSNIYIYIYKRAHFYFVDVSLYTMMAK